jgi:hypothetical protein
MPLLHLSVHCEVASALDAPDVSSVFISTPYTL